MSSGEFQVKKASFELSQLVTLLFYLKTGYFLLGDIRNYNSVSALSASASASTSCRNKVLI